MMLHGSIIENLENAVASARRLRGHPVYRDTLIYWSDLIREARRARESSKCADRDALEAAIIQLETEMSDRDA